MKPENIEKWIKDTDIDTNAGMDELVLDDVLKALEESKKQTAVKQPNIWRIIMKSKISKLAAAAVIAIAVMLPLSYGAAKIIKRFSIFKFTYKKGDTTYTASSTLSGDNIHSEEDAKKTLEEFGKLYREGKAKEIKPGLWQVTLSNGEKFAYGGRHPELAGLVDTEEAKQILKKEFDEIEKLRKAGKFEKIYKPEHDFDVNGVKHRYFEARYTLSSGEVITIGSSEPAEDKDKE